MIADSVSRILDILTGRRWSDRLSIDEEIVRCKKDFFLTVDAARWRVSDKKYLEKKWLRPTDQLFDWYFREYQSIHCRPGISVFDVGAGPGYLMWFLQELGRCSVEGLESADREDYQVLWKEMKWSGKIAIASVKPFVPVPYGSRPYDLIVATGICFNRFHGDKNKLWGDKEWMYFLTDACSHLNPDGEIWCRFNRPVGGKVLEMAVRLNILEAPRTLRIERERFWAAAGRSG